MRNQMRFDGQRLFKASINIKKRFSSIGNSRVRQTELLSSNHSWTIGEIRQHQLWRKRAITRNPQRTRMLRGELFWMYILTSRLFYFNVYIFIVFAATPPKGHMGVIACHITIRVDQFYCCSVPLDGTIKQQPFWLSITLKRIGDFVILIQGSETKNVCRSVTRIDHIHDTRHLCTLFKDWWDKSDDTWFPRGKTTREGTWFNFC